MTTFIIIVFVGFIVFAVYYNVKRQKKLTSEGRILPRPGNWYLNAETFTLSGADFGRVTAGIQTADLAGAGVSVKKSDEKKALWFVGGTWQSVLHQKEDADGKNVYDYFLQHWKEHNGATQNVVEMNMVLTAVEKTLLAIDPAAQVTTRPLDVKTRTSLF